MYYNRFRYYDPNICAFISQDPLGLAAGTNLYQYAPNIWGWIDPLGLCKNSTSNKATQNKAQPLTRESLIDALTGKTQQGNKVGQSIKSGDISSNVLGDELFDKAYKLKGGEGSAPQAFAYGDEIFIRKNSANLFSDTVHEGTHAIDYLNDFNGNVYQWEKRAFFYERQFQKAGGGQVEFETVDEMMGFMYENY